MEFLVFLMSIGYAIGALYIVYTEKQNKRLGKQSLTLPQITVLFLWALIVFLLMLGVLAVIFLLIPNAS